MYGVLGDSINYGSTDVVTSGPQGYTKEPLGWYLGQQQEQERQAQAQAQNDNDDDLTGLVFMLLLGLLGLVVGSVCWIINRLPAMWMRVLAWVIVIGGAVTTIELARHGYL